MKFDLHNHSKFSDGTKTIDELVVDAKNNGVTCFALTDHDSVLGDLTIKEEYKNIIFPGIELSTKLNGDSVHIIGLFKGGIIPDEIIEFSKEYLRKRRERAILMMNNIESIYGLKIDLDKLLSVSENTAITRGNMLRNLCECNNISFEKARFYISNESRAYLPMSRILPADGINFLHKNNCIAILAHPVLLKKETYEMLIDLPFDGVEVRYPANGIDDEKNMKLDLADKDVFFSAGSDYHGDKSHAMIGTATLDEKEFKVVADLIGYDIERLQWK